MSEPAVTHANPPVSTTDWTPPPGALRSLTFRFIARSAQILFRLLWRCQVIGLENIPRTGGVLLACNHVSNLDPPLLGCMIYRIRPSRFMGKTELWNNRFFSKIVEQVGGFPVQRHTADRATLRRVLDWLKVGEAVAMFPEGERSLDGTLQPAQPGITLLVQKSGVPVVPVACVGTYASWPRGRKLPRLVPLKLVFGKPITFSPTAKREEVTTILMQAIADLLTANGQPTDAPIAAEGTPKQKAEGETPAG